MLKIKKGDQVKIVAGKDKGKSGEVTRVYRKTQTVLVSGVNLYKKHLKPSQNREGGIMSVERPLSMAKIALLENNQPIRVGFKLDGDQKLRVSKKTGGNL